MIKDREFTSRLTEIILSENQNTGAKGEWEKQIYVH
jgi:hypothetical protein